MNGQDVFGFSTSAHQSQLSPEEWVPRQRDRSTHRCVHFARSTMMASYEIACGTQIIIGGPDSREGKTKGPINPSRLMLAAQHSKHAGRDFPSLDIGADSFASASGAVAVVEQTGHRTAFNSSRTFWLPGSLIPGLARVHLRQKSSRCIAKRLQDIILSAGGSGLVVAVYGQHSDGRKKKCPLQRRYGFVPITG